MSPPLQLTKHFTLAELTRSVTAARLGIDNTPPEEVALNLQQLAVELEKVRVLCGGPLLIHSGYRCLSLNTAVGGSKDSYHLLGCAADFDPPAGMTHDHLQQAIASQGTLVAFDLIMEEGTIKPEAEGGSRWLHFQIAKPGAAPRYRVKDAIVDHLGGTITRVVPG